MLNMRFQQGSSLLFALIFLLVLTVLALSTMSTSYLDEKMAANSQFKNQAFQAAQSEGQGQFDHYKINHSYLENAYSESLKLPGDQQKIKPREQVRQANLKIKKELELKFIQTAQPPSGFSFDIFVGLLYDQQTIAKIEASSAASDQTLGINYAAPNDIGRL